MNMILKDSLLITKKDNLIIFEIVYTFILKSVSYINPNRAEIFSHLIPVRPPPPLISGHSGDKGTN